MGGMHLFEFLKNLRNIPNQNKEVIYKMKKRILCALLTLSLCIGMMPISAFATESRAGLDIEGELGEKTASIIADNPGEYEVTVQVPGNSQKSEYVEVIIMADASDSINKAGNWTHFKNMVNALGNNLLSEHTSLKLTLMGFGIGAKHAGTFNTPEALNAFMETATTEDFLQERSATNCEVGLTFVQDYIENSPNIDHTYVVYLSDAAANMTEKKFNLTIGSYTNSTMQYLVKAEIQNILAGQAPLTVTEKLFPIACETIIGLREKYAANPEEVATELNTIISEMLEKAPEYGKAIEEAAMNMSSADITQQYSASQLEKIFQTYFRTVVGKDNPFYSDYMDHFYICLLMPMSNQMPDDNLRAAQASLSLQQSEKVSGLYHVCYSRNKNNWMNPEYAKSNFNVEYTDKVTYLYGADFGEAINTLNNKIDELKETIYKDVTVNDPMSEWVILKPETIAIYERNTKIYQYGEGEGTGWLIDNPPVVDENGDPAEPITLTLNENGLYEIEWKIKTGNLSITDQYSLKYIVKLNEEAEGYVPGTSYPLNDPTSVTYTDENEEKQTKEIPVPEGRVFIANYEYVSGTPGMNLPIDFVPVPVDTGSYNDKTDVNAKSPETLTFADAENDGVWTFKKWDADTKQIDGANITFIGEWVFEANTYTVDYEYVSGTPGMDLPTDFVPVPVDTGSYNDKTDVNAKSPETLTFADAENDGVWTFKKWDADTKQIDGANIIFVGEWVFEANLDEPSNPTVPDDGNDNTPTTPDHKDEGEKNPDISIADVPQTGDDSHMVLWFGLMLASVCGFAVLVFTEKKRRNAK